MLLLLPATSYCQKPARPGGFGPLASQWGDAARLPTSQCLCDEPGMAPLPGGTWQRGSVLGGTPELGILGM